MIEYLRMTLLSAEDLSSASRNQPTPPLDLHILLWPPLPLNQVRGAEMICPLAPATAIVARAPGDGALSDQRQRLQSE
jgi:hypothetical protein